MFYLKLDSAANVSKVEATIKGTPGMERYSVRSMREYLSMMTPDNLPGFDLAIRIVMGVAVVVGFIVIFQAMHTAVTERTREIGILKSLGASKWYVVNVIVRETLRIAVVGVILGIVISITARRVIMFEKPVLRLYWSNAWALRAALIAIVGELPQGQVIQRIKLRRKIQLTRSRMSS